MLKLVRFLKPYKVQVILGPMFKLVEAVFELIIPLIMARVIDIGVKNRDVGYVFKMGIVMILLGAVGFCSTFVCQYFSAKSSQGFGTNLRNALFEHINEFSHRELDKFSSGSLITRLTSDVNQLQLSVAMFIRLVIRAPFLIVGSIIMAISIDLKISMIFLVTSLLISVSLYFIITKSVPFLKKIQKSLDKLALIAKEDLEGTRVIRAFSKLDWSKSRFNNVNSDILEISCRVSKISSLLNPVTYVAINLAIVCIIWFGGMRAYHGDITQGEIIALVNYMMQILLALIVVSNLIVIFTKAFVSADRINEILDTKISIQNNYRKIYVKSENAIKIEFDTVSFKYTENSKYAIENINLSIDYGEKVGIIGATGSGKSTFVNLIPRFYDVSKGSILLNGINVKDYNILDLRRRISIVYQNSVLFRGTIKQNLRWGKEDASDKEIKEALEISQSLDFVNEKPNKFNELVEEGGRNFSGGQKQRLTIARAIIKKPEILILDDSFSALDQETENRLRNALMERFKDNTIIFISQKSKSIKNCDKIIVFDNGKIVGEGNHNSLLETCGVYKNICESQSC